MVIRSFRIQRARSLPPQQLPSPVALSFYKRSCLSSKIGRLFYPHSLWEDCSRMSLLERHSACQSAFIYQQPKSTFLLLLLCQYFNTWTVTPLLSIVEISSVEELKRTQLTPLPIFTPSATITMCLVAPSIAKSRSCPTVSLEACL